MTIESQRIAAARRAYNDAIAPYWREYCALTPVGTTPEPGVLEKYLSARDPHLAQYEAIFKANYIDN